MQEDQIARKSRREEHSQPRTKTRRHFVYIVTCSDGTLYTGYTTDADRRLGEHNSGSGSRYTRARRPVVLAYLEEKDSRGSALKRELEIKSLDKTGKLLLCRKYRSREKPS